MSDLKWISAYLRPCRGYVIAAMVLVAVESVFEMVIPLLMTSIVDVGIPRGDRGYLLTQGGWMALCALLALATGLLYARCAARAAYGFGAQLRLAQYRRIQDYAFSDLDHFSAPSLVTRITTDVTVVQNAVTTGLRPLVRSPIMLAMGIGFSFLLNPRLALVFVVATPLLGAILAVIVSRAAPLYREQQQAVDALNAQVQEDLTAIRAVKAFVREDTRARQFDRANRALSRISGHTFSLAQCNMPAFQGVMYAAVVALMWFGGRLIMAGAMTVGQLTGFLTYVLQVMNSLMLISNVFLLLTRSLASARRIREVLEHTPSLSDPPHPVEQVADGRVDFDSVSFQYAAGTGRAALSGVDLHIAAGETIGILGGTGSAKSTLVQLIPRLYDVTQGTVRVGGVDVRDYRLETLRDAVAIVLQKNVLFSGTVRDNLRWGDPQADDAAMWQACAMAGADEVVAGLPNGLDSRLEQGGANLSGGQRQRLCIARALLRRPKILILDDSTSAVDTATEGRIRTALDRGLSGVTRLIIAQRVTSVMGADRIVILEDGQIHGVGTHQQLLAEDCIYQEICRSQLKEEDAYGQGI